MGSNTGNISRSIPRPGIKYRHFKGHLYQVLCTAKHSETGEQMVVYQALYGVFEVYCRPLTMFLSEVDREKYPQTTQQYRFEEWDEQQSENIDTLQTLAEIQATPKSVTASTSTATPESKEYPEGINRDLIDFLDAEDAAEKLEILYSIQKRIDERLITDIEIAIGLSVGDGSIEDRVDLVRRHLKMQGRFETNRLR